MNIWQRINQKRLMISVLILFLLLLLYFLYIHYQFAIPCLFHEITGWYCPGCGITRVFISLSHGNIGQAFRYNSLVTTLFPVAVILLGNSYYCWLLDRKETLTKKVPNWIWYCFIMLAIFFAILRNMSLFSFLAPTTL